MASAFPYRRQSNNNNISTFMYREDQTVDAAAVIESLLAEIIWKIMLEVFIIFWQRFGQRLVAAICALILQHLPQQRAHETSEAVNNRTPPQPEAALQSILPHEAVTPPSQASPSFVVDMSHII